MQDRQEEFLEKIKHHSEVVQELVIDDLTYSAILISEHGKELQNSKIKLLKTIEK